jgi:hypothetical protein
MQYSVPQFIDVEDKVIGPLSIKQFLYILAGAGMLFVLWTIAPSIEVFLIPAVPVLGIFLALAFFKVNGRPFTNFLSAAMQYLIRPKVLIWRREFQEQTIKTDVREKQKRKEDKVPKVGQRVTESRLRQLSTVLDTDGGVDQSVYEMSDSEEVSLDPKDTQGMTAEDRLRRVETLLGKR